MDVLVEYELTGRHEPYRKHDGDAGFDLRVQGDTLIQKGEWTSVPLGLKVSLPAGHCALLLGRSSLWKRGLSVRVGLIDQGYRGEIAAIVRYDGEGSGTFLASGFRLCQLLVLPIPSVTLTRVASLCEDTDRGTGGFGSTGDF